MKNFDLNKLTGDEAKSIVQSLATGFQATIQKQQTSSDKLISTLVLDLSVARTRTNPLKISFPFISVRVESATDIQSNCRIIPVSIDSYQDDTLLKLNDSLEFDNGISNVFITNAAQAGKQMVLKFYTTARVRSGSLVLDQNSSVNNLTIGESTLANDGFTYTMSLILNGIPSASGLVQTFVSAYNNNSLMNGNVSVLFPLPNIFKVPMGYTAEITGAEIECGLAFASNIWGIDFNEVDDGSSYADYNALANSNTGKCSIAFNKVVSVSPPFKAFVRNECFNVEIKSGIKSRTFREGKCIVVSVYNVAASGTGAAKIYYSIRLTKNVGA